MTSKDAKESARQGGSKSSVSEDRAWDRAVAWLARCDRSVAETSRYLERIGCTPDIARRILERLQARGFLDDERLALLRAQAWLRRGYGRERARADLEARGLAEEPIARALEESFAGEDEVARALVQRRFPRARTDPREYGRAVRFLRARGFLEEVVVAILGEGC